MELPAKNVTDEALVMTSEIFNRRLHEKIPDDYNIDFKEYHCSNCGRFLCLQAIVEGTIAIKCRRCKELNVLDIRSVEEPLDKEDK